MKNNSEINLHFSKGKAHITKEKTDEQTQENKSEAE
jgi:hypothetical protein